MSDSILVYSTESGRIQAEKVQAEPPKGDGIVRIQRQISGRKGSGVCVISGLELNDDELKKLAAELKKTLRLWWLGEKWAYRDSRRKT